MRMKEKELLLLITIFFEFIFALMEAKLRPKESYESIFIFIHIDSFKGVKSVQKAEPF